jgi:c-di-AMP phosphodiesterase-like protein
LSLLLIFAAATFFFSDLNQYIAVAEAIVAIGLAFYLRASYRKRTLKLHKYIDSLTSSTESATKGTLLNFPLPVVIFSPNSGVILWSNSRFLALVGAKERFLEVRLDELIPELPTKWLLDGKNECPELMSIGGRRYKSSAV